MDKNIENLIKNQSEFEKEFYKRNPPGAFEKLKARSVGIAGAGGLGSNIAVALVRSGVYNLYIADFDRIEASNLNRQQYNYEQIGMYKVDALRENLLKINPFININVFKVKLSPENISQIFGNADILLEAFDRADMKAMLAEEWFRITNKKYLVMGSGLAGTGSSDALKIEIYDKLVICGDQQTQACEANGLIAPRVAIVANMQANVSIELLLGGF